MTVALCSRMSLLIRLGSAILIVVRIRKWCSLLVLGMNFVKVLMSFGSSYGLYVLVDMQIADDILEWTLVGCSLSFGCSVPVLHA